MLFCFNTIDRYLNKHDLFKSSVLLVHGCDLVLHTTPAELLMQTITVCGLHYYKHGIFLLLILDLLH